jgi:hypothetical protein
MTLLEKQRPRPTMTLLEKQQRVVALLARIDELEVQHNALSPGVPKKQPAQSATRVESKDKTQQVATLLARVDELKAEVADLTSAKDARKAALDALVADLAQSTAAPKEGTQEDTGGGTGGGTSTAALSPVGLLCVQEKVPAQPEFADAVNLMLARELGGRPAAKQIGGLLAVEDVAAEGAAAGAMGEVEARAARAEAALHEAQRQRKASQQRKQASRLHRRTQTVLQIAPENIDKMCDLQPGTTAVCVAVRVGVAGAQEQERELRGIAAGNEQQLQAVEEAGAEAAERGRVVARAERAAARASRAASARTGSLDRDEAAQRGRNEQALARIPSAMHQSMKEVLLEHGGAAGRSEHRGLRGGLDTVQALTASLKRKGEREVEGGGRERGSDHPQQPALRRERAVGTAAADAKTATEEARNRAAAETAAAETAAAVAGNLAALLAEKKFAPRRAHTAAAAARANTQMQAAAAATTACAADEATAAAERARHGDLRRALAAEEEAAAARRGAFAAAATLQQVQAVAAAVAVAEGRLPALRFECRAAEARKRAAAEKVAAERAAVAAAAAVGKLAALLAAAREGLLKKKGKSFPYSSSVRRFVLTDEYLERFDPKSGQSKGKLVFAAGCSVREEAKPANSFTVACGGEEHLLQAASAAERAEWVADVKRRFWRAAESAGCTQPSVTGVRGGYRRVFLVVGKPDLGAWPCVVTQCVVRCSPYSKATQAGVEMGTSDTRKYGVGQQLWGKGDRSHDGWFVVEVRRLFLLCYCCTTVYFYELECYYKY